MAEVLDLSKQKSKTITKDKGNIPTKDESLVQRLLRELYKQANSITDIMVCTKDSEGELKLFHTDLDIRDRSYIIQIIQADVTSEFSPTEDMSLGSDH